MRTLRDRTPTTRFPTDRDAVALSLPSTSGKDFVARDGADGLVAIVPRDRSIVLFAGLFAGLFVVVLALLLAPAARAQGGHGQTTFPMTAEPEPEPVDLLITEHMPEDFPLLPVPKANPLTQAKIALGESLFFDPILSADGTISCASCHKPEAHFADTVALSKGVGGSAGPRNTPTVLNSAYYPRLLGDGRSFDLEDQVRYPITHELEMRTTTEKVVQVLAAHDEYPARFAEAFGSRGVTYDRITEALATFERTLFTGNSPFDRFYFQGDSRDFTPAAKRGWLIFQSTGRCMQCHKFSAETPFFTDHSYHNTGISWDTKKPNLGRYMVTKAREDKGRQRTPPLRDVARTAPYMHDGRFQTLAEVVEFYRAGGVDNYFIDDKMQPLEISDQDASDLVEFLRSLTGEMSYPHVAEPSADARLAANAALADPLPPADPRLEAAGARPGAAPAPVRLALPATTGKKLPPDSGPLGPGTGPERPVVELVAGSHRVGDGGPANRAVLATIGGLVIAPGGDVYFSDSGHNRVRRIDFLTGTISTVAGTGYLSGDSSGAGRALETHLASPGPLALSADASQLFIGEILGRKIRRLDLASQTLEDIRLPKENFGDLSGILWRPEGLWIVDSRFGQIWHRPTGGDWQPFLPDSARLDGGARGLAMDGQGRLHVAEYFAHRIRRWNAEEQRWDPVVGTGERGRSAGGQAVEARIRTPDGLAFDAEDNLYFSDMGNRRVCRVLAETGQLQVVHAAGPRGTPERYTPGPMAFDRLGSIWIGDVYANRVLRFRQRLDPAAPRTVPDVVAGGGDPGDGGPATDAALSHPGSVVADAEGNIYIADAVQHRVRRVDAKTGRITTVAGAGTPGYNGDVRPATEAWLSYPGEILVDSEAGRLYIADYYNHRVRLVDLEGGSIVTIAGSGKAGETGDGGPAPFAHLLNPHALFLDRESDSLIVASAVSSRLRSVDLDSGSITSLPFEQEISPNLAFYSITQWNGGLVLTSPRPSGVYFYKNGQLGSLLAHPDVYFPQDVAVSPSGELYICETGRNRILRWRDGRVEVVLENLGRPRAISFDANGDLLVADTFHSRVLRAKVGGIEPSGLRPLGEGKPVLVAESTPDPRTP